MILPNAAVTCSLFVAALAVVGVGCLDSAELSDSYGDELARRPARSCGGGAAPSPDPAEATGVERPDERPTSNDVPDSRDYASRPFAADSPWNAPIPVTATYRANDPRTTAIRSTGAFGTNTRQWTIWVWKAEASDPSVTIDVSVRNLSGAGGDANAGTVQLALPPGAHPDPANDSHMVVVDPDRRHAHEFWYAKKSGTGYTAVSYAKVPLDGSGVDISGYASHNSEYLTYGWGATRAYGGSSLGGLIRKGELTGGPIEHAIAVAIPARYLGGRAVWPATSDDQSSDYAGNIPMGTRFAIPPEVKVESLGLSPAHERLARALQRYGAIVVDKSGAPCMYAEGSEAQAEGDALNASMSQMATIHGLLTVVD